jgi:transcriptional regulator with XRE-family HTH domain
VSDVHKFLKELRLKKKMTLRDAAIKSGLSHSYISSLEQGKHPKTKAPINPSPESLERLSAAYNYPYEDLMKMSGYIKESKNKESAPTLSDSEFERIVREIEEEEGIDLHGNPIAHQAVKDALNMIIKTTRAFEKK